jgi:hypothetical protein
MVSVPSRRATFCAQDATHVFYGLLEDATRTGSCPTCAEFSLAIFGIEFWKYYVKVAKTSIRVEQSMGGRMQTRGAFLAKFVVMDCDVNFS